LRTRRNLVALLIALGLTGIIVGTVAGTASSAPKQTSVTTPGGGASPGGMVYDGVGGDGMVYDGSSPAPKP
jgi:hypothetical protein